MYNILKNIKNKEDEYSCEIDEAVTAQMLFDKIKNDLDKMVNQYGYEAEYAIPSSNIAYSVLFIDNITRVRLFNRINFLLNDIGYKMDYKNTNNQIIYKYGNVLIISKLK